MDFKRAEIFLEELNRLADQISVGQFLALRDRALAGDVRGATKMLDRLTVVIHAKKPPQRGGLRQNGQNPHFVRIHKTTGHNSRF